MRRDRKYPGASKFFDRHGKLRWRARRKGMPTVMLPGAYGSQEFEEAWAAWASGAPIVVGKNRTVPGTIDALIIDYCVSSEFAALSETTRKTYRALLERFRQKNGNKNVASITAQSIITGVRDKLKPHAWNMMLRALKHLCRFAVLRGKLMSDPTTGLHKAKTSKSEGFHTWTIEEVEQFEIRHPVGTKARLALAVLLYTAQRRADAVTLGRQHEIDGGTNLRFRQKKTGEWLILPIVAPLRAALDACPPKGLSYIETAHGRPFTPAGFGNWFRDRCDEAGLSNCSAHGLRKAAATRLADAGCSVHEIKAITGHKSLSEVERYTKAADQKRLAQGVAHVVAGTNDERNIGKPVTRFANSRANPLKLKG
jgi:integrase